MIFYYTNRLVLSPTIIREASSRSYENRHRNSQLNFRQSSWGTLGKKRGRIVGARGVEETTGPQSQLSRAHRFSQRLKQ